MFVLSGFIAFLSGICGMNHLKMPIQISNGFQYLECNPPCWLLILSIKSTTIAQQISNLKKRMIDVWVSSRFSNEEKEGYKRRRLFNVFQIRFLESYFILKFIIVSFVSDLHCGYQMAYYC